MKQMTIFDLLEPDPCPAKKPRAKKSRAPEPPPEPAPEKPVPPCANLTYDQRVAAGRCRLTWARR